MNNKKQKKNRKDIKKLNKRISKKCVYIMYSMYMKKSIL